MTPTPREPLRLLHLEDSELDHELMLAHMRRAGVPLSVVRVETEADFLQALERDWDVVLSDYNLPGFSGLVALDLLKVSGKDLPFILVSGEIGEETAVEAMRNGASDYLLKNNLSRLAPAVLHAVEASRTRQARQLADLELGASKQRLHELAQHLQTSVEQERAAIAREIHDDVGGSLTALKFDLAWMARRSSDPEVLERVNSALETVTSAIEASQRIMHNLRPAILEQGLVAALQWMAARFEPRTGITCVLRLPSHMPDLPAGVPLVAYRTAQEALTNVSKHAQATKVEIDLSLAGGVLSLEISDNGRGLETNDLEKVRSFGIRGLHERARTVGGWVDLSSHQAASSATGQHGTTLILSVPLPTGIAAVRTGPVSAVRDGLNPESPSSNTDADPTGWGSL
jgi:signal transduction histidine kinase